MTHLPNLMPCGGPGGRGEWCPDQDSALSPAEHPGCPERQSPSQRASREACRHPVNQATRSSQVLKFTLGRKDLDTPTRVLGAGQGLLCTSHRVWTTGGKDSRERVT